MSLRHDAKKKAWSLRVGYVNILKECENFETALFWAKHFQNEHFEQWGYRIPIKFVGDTPDDFIQG